MKIVIELTDEMYANVQAEVERSIHPSRDPRWTRLLLAICNGEVLPKGHGRLIDERHLREDMERAYKFANELVALGFAESFLEHAPTIIEADEKGTQE